MHEKTGAERLGNQTNRVPCRPGPCAENSFWRKLELFIQEKTGVEPRCWHETDYSWTEQERPDA